MEKWVDGEISEVWRERERQTRWSKQTLVKKPRGVEGTDPTGS